VDSAAVVEAAVDAVMGVVMVAGVEVEAVMEAAAVVTEVAAVDTEAEAVEGIGMVVVPGTRPGEVMVVEAGGVRFV